MTVQEKGGERGEKGGCIVADNDHPSKERGGVELGGKTKSQKPKVAKPGLKGGKEGSREQRYQHREQGTRHEGTKDAKAGGNRAKKSGKSAKGGRQGWGATITRINGQTQF